MLLGVEKVENGMVALRIQIPKEAFKEGLSKAYLKEKGQFNLPGFRKGKAPRKIIENYYGDSVFFEAAVDEVFPEEYKKALGSENLEPVEQPSVDVEQIGQDKDLVLVAKVTVRPEVTLGKYKGVEVEKVLLEVSEKDIEAELEKIAEKNARYKDVERTVKDGDRVLLDYSGSVEGVKFEGGTAQGQQLDIGSNTFIPGFEEQIVGMKKSEEKDIKVTFPSDYHAPDLQGKAAVFAVKINEIKEKDVPKLDDEFAKDVSEYDTLKEYKHALRKKLEEAAGEEMKNQVANDAMDAAIDNMQVEIPLVMEEIEIGRLVRDFEQKLRNQGMDLKMYLDYVGATMEQLKQTYRVEAGRLVKSRLMMEEIEKAENLEVTQADIEAEYQVQAEKYGKTLEEYKKLLPPGDMEYQKGRMKWKMIIDSIVDNAKVKEVKKKTEKKAPAKKAPTKKATKTGEEKEKKTTAAKKAAEKES